MLGGKYSRASTRLAKRSRLKRVVHNFYLAALPVALLALIFFLARADFWQIRKFEVQGLAAEDTAALAQFAQQWSAGKHLIFVPKTNWLFLKNADLAAAVKQNFSDLAEVKVEKNLLSHSLQVSVVAYEPVFIWCDEGGGCFLANQAGLVFERLTTDNVSTTTLVTVRGGIAGEPLLKNFASPAVLANLRLALLELQKANFPVQEIILESEDKAVFRTNLGSVFLNLNESIIEPLRNTFILIDDQRRKNPEIHFEYIDARYGNKVFYKLL